MKIKLSVFYLVLLMALGQSAAYSQIYSFKDIINQNDPFTITFNDLVLSTNDEDFKENYNFVIVATIFVGNEKIIKFIGKDDVIINNIKTIGDELLQVNMTVKKNNVLLMPALFTIPSNTNSITMRLEGYSNLSAVDQNTLMQMSTGFCYVSSTVYYFMEQAYKYISTSPDVNRPNNSLLTSAEVLQQNMKTRVGVFYLGNPLEVAYIIPKDPKNVIGTNILIQGKKPIESPITSKSKDVVSLTFNKYTDIKIVQAEPYYKKIMGVFHDLTNLTIVPNDRREGYIFKAQEIISEDLVVGLKQNVYLNDQVTRQYTNLLNLLKAGIRVKSDSVQTTNEVMKSDEREALSFFESNLRDNDFSLDNQYVFDDFINSSVNRGILYKEIDQIKRYYEIK